MHPVVLSLGCFVVHLPLHILLPSVPLKSLAILGLRKYLHLGVKPPPRSLLSTAA